MATQWPKEWLTPLVYKRRCCGEVQYLINEMNIRIFRVGYEMVKMKTNSNSWCVERKRKSEKQF